MNIKKYEKKDERKIVEKFDENNKKLDETNKEIKENNKNLLEIQIKSIKR